jgi:hypothetical protein
MENPISLFVAKYRVVTNPYHYPKQIYPPSIFRNTDGNYITKDIFTIMTFLYLFKEILRITVQKLHCLFQKAIPKHEFTACCLYLVYDKIRQVPKCYFNQRDTIIHL